jgi:hypothetical protein
VTGNGIKLEEFRPFRAEGEWKKGKGGANIRVQKVGKRFECWVIATRKRDLLGLDNLFGI